MNESIKKQLNILMSEKVTFHEDLFDLSEMTQSAISYINKNLDDEIIKYLKEKGFRPKKTVGYMKSLGYRLRKKGLYLEIKPFTATREDLTLEFGYTICLMPIIKPLENAQVIKVKPPKLKEVKYASKSSI